MWAKQKNQLTRKNSFELELERIISHTTEEFEKLKKKHAQKLSEEYLNE